MKEKLIFFALLYFKFFAKLQLLKIRPFIIGVTGSAGKTSTRNAIFSVIKQKYRVKVSYKANSESGIPLNILGLTPKNFSILEWLTLVILCPLKLITNWKKYDIYLVEMGIDSPKPPKNMGYLLTILKPDIGIVLNAAPMHSEPFDYLVTQTDPEKRATEITKLIAAEKGKIVTHLSKKKIAIINEDQKEITDLKPKIQAKLITFGTKKTATVQIVKYSVNTSGTEFLFRVNQEELYIQCSRQLLPQHFSQTFAAAISTAVALGIDLTTIKNGLETQFKLPPGRSSLIPGIAGSTLIDSSYNASTQPTLDMLELLVAVPGKRKIAVLADMRELGAVAQIEHEKVAKRASEVCDAVLLIGPQSKQFSLPIIEKTKTQVHWFENAAAAADFLKKQLKKDDVILIKGSQNTLLLEIAVEKLMAQPKDAELLLARRGEFWDQKRAELKK